MVQAQPAIEQLANLKAEIEQVRRERNEFREFVEEIANQKIYATSDTPEAIMEARREEAQDLLKGQQ